MKRVTRPPVKQQQIVRHIRSRIISGRLRPGDRLPTRSQIEKQFNVSSLTGQRAFTHLLGDGFVVARGRSGTFVADYPPHLHRAAIIFPTNVELQREVEFVRVMRQEVKRLDGWQNWRLSMYHYADEQDRRTLHDDIEAHRLAGVIFAWSPHLLADTEIARVDWLTRIAYTTNCPFAANIRFDMRAFVERAVGRLAAQGCRRVAAISPANYLKPDVMDPAIFTSHALPTDRYLFQAGHPAEPEGAAATAELLMRLPPDLRPDGIMICDDNLYRPACDGLRAVAGTPPAIVTHCNFPLNVKEDLPADFLGFDLHFLIQQSLNLLANRRSGKALPGHSRVLPRFREEPADPARLLLPLR